MESMNTLVLEMPGLDRPVHRKMRSFGVASCPAGCALVRSFRGKLPSVPVFPVSSGMGNRDVTLTVWPIFNGTLQVGRCGCTANFDFIHEIS